ncbi:DUF433 domain-containing protein [Azospirillum sp. sgz302134]
MGAMFTAGEFTVAEAAFVADVEPKIVDREISARVVDSSAGPGERRVGPDAVYYLFAIKEFRNDFGKDFRRRVYENVRRTLADHKAVVCIGAFDLPLGRIRSGIQERIDRLSKVRAMVERDPQVCGGEPVLRGTRIPVRTVAGMHQKGVSIAEIAREYGLNFESIDAAVLYDQLHPRRGRPTSIDESAEFELFDVEEHAPFAG